MGMPRTSPVFAIGLSVALLAARAQALNVSPLLEGEFIVNPSDDPLHQECEIDVSGNQFSMSGQIDGVGTGSESVVLDYAAPQTTNVLRTADKLAVKQSEFAELSVAMSMGTVFETALPKCSIQGSFVRKTFKETVSLHCQGDDLSSLLSADQIASFQTAMDRKHIKFKVGPTLKKWSLEISCSGIVQP